MGYESSNEAGATQRLRREIFVLGSRHAGDPLAGALRELQEEGLTAERRILLRAVVRHLTPGAPNAPTATERSTGAANWKYWALICAAGLCGAIQVWRLTH